jgi:hypothetical protein
MSRFEDFKRDQKVAHIRLGDGFVTHVSADKVFVYFDRGFNAEYDRRWFAIYPHYLFHRSDPAALHPAKGTEP